MSPKRIILVRHGRSAANDDPAMYSCVRDYKLVLVVPKVVEVSYERG